MRDLSLHLLDLAQNSVKANATLVTIRLTLAEDGWLTFTLEDDGSGMSEELLRQVRDPFTTTRTTRRVGLGIPMMEETARRTGGEMHIESTLGQGTTLTARLNTRHLDCLPLGDVAGTLLTLFIGCPDKPDFLFEGVTPKGECSFDTRMVRQVLGDIPLNEPAVVAWMQEALQEEINPIFGGVMI
ncbi:MAG: sensor histidine kinase [Clostridiales bacterium]|nr:sensor histidine kinase [Clostridiales bacterium]